jgi:quinoprotein glucose dehydrogenase
VAPPPLVRHELSPGESWGIAYFDGLACRKRMASLRYDGIYTPPTEDGTLVFPGNAGGSNWGGVAVDPERQIVIANVLDLPWAVRLIPREAFETAERSNPQVELSPQEGTPFGLRREPLLSPLSLPCTPPPWGTLVAVDLDDGAILWRRPTGTVADLLPIPLHIELGTPSFGGPLVTATGLVFLAATMDHYLRAFDVETGDELWRGRLPFGGQATPMTYASGGRQYVVIAAGGHARAGIPVGDALVAFALPEPASP